MNKFTTDRYGEPALRCPGCGTGWLHQRRVEVFARGRGDAGEGIHATIEYGEGVTIDRSMEDNPSRRRDGVRITFDCEQCVGETFTLEIVQHKGNEFVSWEDSE